MFIRFLILAFMLGASTAQAAGFIGSSMGKRDEPGYTVDLTSTKTADTYVIGEAFPNASIGFELGSAFVGSLYACDTQTYSASTCDPAIAISADFQNRITNTTRRWYLLTISTAETGSNVSRLNIYGSHDQIRDETCKQSAVAALFDEYYAINAAMASVSFEPDSAGSGATATVTMAMCTDKTGDSTCLSLNYDSDADGVTDTNILTGVTTETSGVKGITGFPFLRIEVGVSPGVGETPFVTVCRR